MSESGDHAHLLEFPHPEMGVNSGDRTWGSVTGLRSTGKRGGHRIPAVTGRPSQSRQLRSLCEPIRAGLVEGEVRALCRCVQMQSPEQRLRKGPELELWGLRSAKELRIKLRIL